MLHFTVKVVLNQVTPKCAFIVGLQFLIGKRLLALIDKLNLPHLTLNLRRVAVWVAAILSCLKN
jgi:hypothetical protein